MHTRIPVRLSAIALLLAIAALNLGFDAALPGKPEQPGQSHPTPAPKQDADTDNTLPPDAVELPDGRIMWVEDFTELVNRDVYSSGPWRAQLRGNSDEHAPGTTWQSSRVDPMGEVPDIDIIQDILVMFLDSDSMDSTEWDALTLLQRSNYQLCITSRRGSVARIVEICDAMRRTDEGEITLTMRNGMCAKGLWPEMQPFLHGETTYTLAEFETWASQQARENLVLDTPETVSLRNGVHRRINRRRSHRVRHGYTTDFSEGILRTSPFIDTRTTGSWVELDGFLAGSRNDVHLIADVGRMYDFQTRPYDYDLFDQDTVRVDLDQLCIASYAGDWWAQPNRLYVLTPGPQSGAGWVPFTILTYDIRTPRAAAIDMPPSAEEEPVRLLDVLDLLTPFGLMRDRQPLAPEPEWSPPHDNNAHQWEMGDLIDAITELGSPDWGDLPEGALLNEFFNGYIVVGGPAEWHAAVEAALTLLREGLRKPLVTEVIAARVPSADAYPTDPTTIADGLALDSTLRHFAGQPLSLNNYREARVVEGMHEQLLPDGRRLRTPVTSYTTDGTTVEVQTIPSHDSQEAFVQITADIVDSLDDDGDARLMSDVNTTVHVRLGQWTRVLLTYANDGESQLLLYIRVTS